jgi:hypothetical protein
VHLDWRQSIQGFGNRAIGDPFSFFQGFTLDHFGNHAAGGDSRGTAKSPEFYVLDDIIGYFDFNMHYIAAGRVANLADPAGLVNLTDIAGIHEMVHHFL